MQALVAWMRSFYSLYEDVEGGAPLLQEVARFTSQRGAPEDDPAFWPLAQKLLALGWVQVRCHTPRLRGTIRILNT